MARRRARTVTPLSTPPSLMPAGDTPHGGVNIRRMMMDHTDEDVLEMGSLVERVFQSPTGDLLYHTVLHLADHCKRTRGTRSAEEVLGELMGYDKVLESWERYILNARELRARRDTEDEAQTVFGAQNG